jgi:cation transport regulator ChaC
MASGIGGLTKRQLGEDEGGEGKHAIGVAYRFRQGKLWRMRAYLDPREALKAVGLAEQRRCRGTGE